MLQLVFLQVVVYLSVGKWNGHALATLWSFMDHAHTRQQGIDKVVLLQLQGSCIS